MGSSESWYGKGSSLIRAIVIGGSPSTWIEVELAKQLCDYNMIITVNRSGVDYDGHIDHWVTYHPENFEDWIYERDEINRYEPVKNLWTASSKHYKGPLQLKRTSSWGGSSGLLGVAVALHNGADKVVLCGVPLDQHQGHYHNKTIWGKKLWKEASRYRLAWTQNMPSMENKVKSFSGWTAKLLGSPTDKWVEP